MLREGSAIYEGTLATVWDQYEVGACRLQVTRPMVM